MSLPAKLKLGILLLIIVILAAAVCLALAPFLISTDAIRLRLARDLSSMTGYNVQLREPPRIRIFPFQASMADVVLTDNAHPDLPIMTARGIIVRMSLWDAISGRARFAETRLIEPRFTLTEPPSAAALRAAFARSPGSFGSALRAAEDKMKDGRDGAHEPLLAQPFGRVIIENGALAYPAPQSAEAARAAAFIGPPAAAVAAAELAPPRWEEISNIQAVLDWPPKSRGAELAAGGLWHGAQTSLNISADDALMLLSGGKTRLRISFNSAKGGITFTGAAQAGADWSARGRLEARSPGLDQTLSWLQIRPPFGLALTSPFTWQSSLKADASAAELGDIILTLGDDATGDSGRGALDIAYENGLPHISGSLAFEKLNLSLPAPALFTIPKSGRDSAIVDMPAFNLLGLDLRVSVGEARFNGVAAQDLGASIQMRPSGLIFDIGTMRIFDGMAQSSLRLASSADRIIGLDSRFATTNTDLAALSRAFAAFGFAPPQGYALRGRANLSLNMQASLPAPAAAPAWPLPEPKPPVPARGKRKAVPPVAAARAEEQTAESARAAPAAPAAAGYYAIFSRDIWPYARGRLNFTINNGRLANFNMADFLTRLQAGAAFAFPPAPAANIAADARPAFSFSRAEGQIEWDKGALALLKAAILFDGRRLEISSAANAGGGAAALSGILDPLPLDKNGQCPDTACLRQSLAPGWRFSVQSSGAGAGAPAPAAPGPKQATAASAAAPAALRRVDNSAPSANAEAAAIKAETANTAPHMEILPQAVLPPPPPLCPA